MGLNFNIKGKKKEEIKPVNEYIINQLEDQLNRGNEGFGTIFIDEKLNVIVKRSTEIAKTLLDIYMKKSKMIILHHRNPTSSNNKLSQTHPIHVKNEILKYEYYVMHNGMIGNCDELKKKHEKLGFIYNTTRKDDWDREEYNDSESLAIELAMYIEKKSIEIETEGSAAFIIIQINKKTEKATKIYFGRKNNPLALTGKQGELRLASEGKGKDINENIMYEIDLKHPEKTKTKTSLNFKEKKEIVYGFNYKRKEKKEEEEKTKEIEMETRIETGTEIRTGTGIGTGMEINETKEALEDIIVKRSGQFTEAIASIIDDFAGKLGTYAEMTQMDIEQEKRQIAGETINTMQAYYNMIQEDIAESIYEEIENKTEKKEEIKDIEAMERMYYGA